MKEQLHGRHLLTMKHHTPAEVEYLVDLAAELKRKKKTGERGHALDGKNIALIFEKIADFKNLQQPQPQYVRPNKQNSQKVRNRRTISNRLLL